MAPRMKRWNRGHREDKAVTKTHLIRALLKGEALWVTSIKV